MSTGDDTLYLRSKLATRRGRPDYGGPGGQWSSPPQFMKDGYVKWAESTRPAREGGAEKIPAEKQMPRKGGADILQVVDDMTKFYEQAKVYAPKVKSLLRNKTVQGKIAKGKYAPQMNKIAEYMDMVGLGHMKHDKAMCQRVGGSKSFQEYALTEEDEEVHRSRSRSPSPEGGRIGMGRVSDAKKAIHALAVRHGGADPSVLEKLQKFGMEVYNWLKANKAVTKAVMESPYLNEKNPLGATELPRKIKGYMEKVGLGIQDDFEGCPPGYIDDGITCRKPITTKSRKQKMPFGVEMDVIEGFEGGEVIGKKYKGKGIGKLNVKMPMEGLSQEDMARAYYGKQGKGIYSKAKNVHSAYKLGKDMGIIGGRQPSEYAMFVKDFARKHPGPDLMKRAGAAWRSR